MMMTASGSDRINTQDKKRECARRDDRHIHNAAAAAHVYTVRVTKRSRSLRTKYSRPDQPVFRECEDVKVSAILEEIADRDTPRRNSTKTGKMNRRNK
jgi:hypothetical protein